MDKLAEAQEELNGWDRCSTPLSLFLYIVFIQILHRNVEEDLQKARLTLNS